MHHRTVAVSRRALETGNERQPGVHGTGDRQTEGMAERQTDRQSRFAIAVWIYVHANEMSP